MVVKTLNVQEIVPYLKQCGYKNDFVRENYTYFSANGNTEKTAEFVAFHQPVYNSYTACIAVLDGNKVSEQQTEALVSSHLSLGSPVVLVYKNDNLQFWQFDGPKTALKEEIKTSKLDQFFGRHKEEFSPNNLCRAKAIGQDNRHYQQFMFLVERKEGEYLSNLMVEILTSFKKNLNSSTDGKWLFQAGFWLIGAKILKDKKVEKFKRLDISNIDELVSKIQEHYSTNEPLDVSNKSQKKALEKAAEIISRTPSLAHITTESFAYVYENTLVSKETRQALGTHATPSWLVNYIVWQVADWISEMPQDDRVIFEPACGHAPFLTAGAKLLSILYKGKDEKRHDYLKNHLIGIEKDSFAGEIARLALTLADIPNKDGWKIINRDIYEEDILSEAAKNAMIFFCNPPFEDFKKEKENYQALETNNKAAEVLKKVLYHLPSKSVFGVILPQGFLHKKNLANIRRYILENFELRGISTLPENGVFGQSKHPATVLLGRKTTPKESISYTRVTKSGLETFKNTYQAEEETISKDELYIAEDFSFKIPELKEIWDYCRQLPKFQEYAEIGRGIEYKDFSKSVRKSKFPNAVKGFGRFEGKKDIKIDQLPDYYWLNTEPDDIENPRYGLKQNVSQIIANYARSGGDVWRIKAYLDSQGVPVTKHFLVIRPKSGKNISLSVIWALTNSPFTNAYMHCNCMERLNMEGILRNMPVPFKSQDLSKLEMLAKQYFELDHAEFTLKDEEKSKREKKRCLLEIDAEILRLYDLPPRLERRLLDFFAGYQRKGVDFKFDRYYKEGFGSNIPLYMYISEEFQNSTVENVMKWVEENRTPGVIEALKKAKEDFGVE